LRSAADIDSQRRDGPGLPWPAAGLADPRRLPRQGRRSQFGRDRRPAALPQVPAPVSDRRIALARLAIITTVTAWLIYFVSWLLGDFLNPQYSSTINRIEAVSYLLIVTMLTASALAYLLSRLGFFYRTREHHRASRPVLEQFFDAKAPALTAIVPSYQEEAQVIRNTLLSVALQEYPRKRITLLIDDPPVPRTRRAREQLAAARALPGQIQALLAEPAARFTGSLRAFQAACADGIRPGPAWMADLIANYDAAVLWLRQLADGLEVNDHADAFFVNEVALRLAADLSEVSSALRDAFAEGVVLQEISLFRLYRRLAWIFRAEVTSFERKRYASLSHEPNKAMNLNSYIGLMGGSYREIPTVAGLVLVPAGPASSDLAVPDPDYVLTLDADSVLLPEYCLRLVHLLEQSEHRDTAIAQTPYSAFPGAASRLERIAGATTDIQHIVHQGLTYYDATFWVGANAIIRKRALDQIVERSYIGDWEIKHYIRDRTVIEDTESTIDMGIHGWRLFNVPERLSYSATPPDFGSLCIQRRRWANGGLLILSKLRRQARARRARGDRTRFGELFLRWNYMASICWSSFSLLVLLAYPFNGTLISPVLGLIALPYFLAMASDLRYCGYKRLDIARIYGFNLILLPVNLAGTVSSLVQGITASKAPFARTPKVKDRTVSPLFFVVAPYALIGLAGYTFYAAYLHHRAENMGYAALNVVLAAYAIVAYVGIRNSVVDVWIHLTSLLFKQATPRRRPYRKRRQETPPAAAADWRSVLQVGSVGSGQWASGRPASLSGAARSRPDPRLPGARPRPAQVSRPAYPDRPAGRDHSAARDQTVWRPIVDLRSGSLAGYEAMVRLPDPDSGPASDRDRED
jgi:cellulose synthase/poly-beta-1,6-N-acetylglucosamine synthase-like glycosyltransferase